MDTRENRAIRRADPVVRAQNRLKHQQNIFNRSIAGRINKTSRERRSLNPHNIDRIDQENLNLQVIMDPPEQDNVEFHDAQPDNANQPPVVVENAQGQQNLAANQGLPNLQGLPDNLQFNLTQENQLEILQYIENRARDIAHARIQNPQANARIPNPQVRPPNPRRNIPINRPLNNPQPFFNQPIQQPIYIPIPNLANNISIPVYKPLEQTASNYIDNLESYFRAQNYNREQWLYVVSTLLKDENKSWFEYTRQHNWTWDNFRQAYIDKYDTWLERNRRAHYLCSRLQRENDDVEKFIWEMVRLAKQVFPFEPQVDLVRRCKQALLPKIRIAIGELQEYSITHLIDRAKIAVLDIKAMDSMNRSTQAHKTDPTNSQQTNASNNTYYQGRGNLYRGRGNYRRNGFNGNGNNSHSNSNNNGNGNSRVFENSNGQSNTSQPNNTNNSNNGNQQQRPSTSNTNGGNHNNHNNGNNGTQNRNRNSQNNTNGQSQGNGNNSNNGATRKKNFCRKCVDVRPHYWENCWHNKKNTSRPAAMAIQNAETGWIENPEIRDTNNDNTDHPLLNC